MQFGQDLGLETLVDDVGNVLIRKPASPGLENVQGVILQAHMDMVPQKTAESDHDFLTDPIDAYVAGDFVVADGTTLGADDGIGMAMAMAILQEQEHAAGANRGAIHRQRRRRHGRRPGSCSLICCRVAS